MNLKYDDKLSLSFTKKYIFALSLIAILSYLAYNNLTTLLNKQKNDSAIINISGKQRMLSQKIALYAIYYKTNKLKAHTDMMEESHEFLLSQEMSESIHNIYFGAPYYLDREIDLYLKNANVFAKTRSGNSLTYLLQNSEIMLRHLDIAVNQYQYEAEMRTSQLKTNELYILLITILVLILEAVFIFRPAVKAITKKTRELNDENEYTNTIIESNTNAIIVVNKNLIVTTFNKSAEDIFGFNKDEMIGKNSLRKIIPYKYTKRYNRLIKRFLKTGYLRNSNRSYELQGKKNTGELFHIRCSFGVNKEAGRFLLILSIQDINKEKFQENQLIQQSRSAAMGEMIGNIAHQWRQPLSMICTLSSGTKLQKQAGMIDDEDVYKSFEDITRHTQYLSQTIDDFRNFFKTDNKKENFSVNKVIKESISLTSALFKNNNIKLDFKEHNEELFFNGKKNELAQVIMNILQNAKDVLNEKNIQDKVVQIRMEKHNKCILIEIQDNGKGVPVEIMDKIFDPYFTTKHQLQGTGIGLFMSKQIIVQHFNGMLEIENKSFTVNGTTHFGASFLCTLPCVNG